MKRKVLFSLLVIVGLLTPMMYGTAAQAAGPEMLYLPAVMIPSPDLDLVDMMAITARVEAGMIDMWVFVDADRNGVYSAGDDGLTDAVACIANGTRFSSCVGTDEGDTWWEDLRGGRYLGNVNQASLPPGMQLRSIRCQETGSQVEYRGCSYNLATWTTHIHLGKTTRINIFYALEP